MPFQLFSQEGYFIIFVVLFSGLLIGAFMGAMPGLTATVAVALMFPPSMQLPSLLGILFLSAVYTGGVYGGGVMSIALNIPGSGAAVATTFDGYPMTRKGKYYEAVGYGLGASLVGCFLAYLAIFFLLVPIGTFAIRFGPPEMLMVAIFAIAVIGVVTGDLIRSVVAGFLGLLLGTIGSTPMGIPRGTFGFFELIDGVPFVVAIIGLFAISEAIFLLNRKEIVEADDNIPKFNFGKIMFGFKGAFTYYWNLLRSSMIGLGVGIIPAAGSTIASMMSYGRAKASAKDPDSFGQGNPEGVVAAEAANNGSEAGSMSTMLAFGIPGSGATAILLGAFMMHGMTPGPYLVRDHIDFAYAVIISNFFQAFLLLFAGILLIAFIGKVISVPIKILVPLIIATSVVGTFAYRGMMFDVYVLFLFGILGYFLRQHYYPLISVVLGLVLADMLEGEFFRTITIYSNGLWPVFQRPIFLTLLAATIISLLIPLYKVIQKNRSKPESNL
ncbi:tripartite tricarboxylate transporter permease [Salisediminibacterium beveridgei]|nr:tripartite tricarboxylate transporter permease [Salisediminibacterium beveridgei]